MRKFKSCSIEVNRRCSLGPSLIRLPDSCRDAHRQANPLMLCITDEQD